MGRSLSISLFLFVLLGMSIIFVRVEAIGPDPHEGNCQSCHLAGSKVTRANASQLHRSQEALCGQCHKNAIIVSHATGFTPQRKIPQQYPLDWKGDITCSTCHAIHSKKAGLIRGAKRGRAFCIACHSEAFFNAMADGGTSIINAGHLDARTDLQRLALDPFTLQCMGCHSGKGGGAPVLGIDGQGIVRHATNSINHPVGMRYEKSISFGGYRPAIQLSKSILLPEGKVACVSCHQGYARQHGALVMSNRGSKLCFECHDL